MYRPNVKNVRIDRHSTPDIVRDLQGWIQILMVAAVSALFFAATEHPTQQK
jgi:hypothetical protein